MANNRAIGGRVEPPADIRPAGGDKWFNALPKQEQSAVTTWQGTAYKDIRKYQMTGKGTNAIKNTAKNLESALAKSKPFEGNVWRGLNNLDDTAFANLRKAKEVKWDAFASCTSKQDVAVRFLEREGNNVMLQIQNKSGVLISHGQFAGEAEVLMAQGARLRVVSQEWKTFTTASRKIGAIRQPGIKKKALQIILQEI